MNTMRQNRDGKQRLVVHLFSDLNTTAHHALPVDDVPLREEVLPIYNVKIRFDGNYKLSRIHEEPAGPKPQGGKKDLRGGK
ncbi:MAG: hypothetical protein U0894_07700 [Pirellulales bacterium]